MKRRAALRRHLPGIGGKFGVLLPAQRRPAQHDAMLLGAGLERVEPTPLAEVGEGRAVALAGIARGVEGKVQNAARRLDRRERPRVHLAEHGGAQGMRLEPPAAFDADFGCHGPCGGMRHNFWQGGGLQVSYPALQPCYILNFALHKGRTELLAPSSPP